jgi:aspartyl-tRNA(Asn)/glutamyl-tRNA(Gln) amidotransferase subunit A
MQEKLFVYEDSSACSASDGRLLSEMSLAVQPNMSVLGWPTEAGSRALAGFTAIYDATAVERLKAAGAAIKGSVCMSEFGFGLAGDSAAAVLGRDQVDAVLMTDTMGEVRVAACLAGAFGFKPSYGMVSRFGLIGLIPSMECFGILAKNLQDIAKVMSVMAGNDPRDLSMPEFGGDVEPPDFEPVLEATESIGTLGVVIDCFDRLSKDESRAFEAMISKLETSGLQIQKVRLKDFDLALTVHHVIGAVEASSSAGKYDGVRYGHRAAEAKNWNEMYLNSRAESFGLMVKTYLFQGAYFQYENYDAILDAARIRTRLIAETEAALERCDLLMLPARCGDVDPLGAATIDAVYDVFAMTLMANITGHPAVTLPGMVKCRDTDLGLQLIGPRFKDSQLLSMAVRLMDLARKGI